MIGGTFGQVLLVGAGGFLGAIMRFGLSGFVSRLTPAAGFPWGTFAVNLSGCLVIGFLSSLAEIRQVIGFQMRLFFLMGVLGAFTTYSTFGYETHAMIRDGELGKAAANVVLHMVVCLSAVWVGSALAKAVLP